MSREACCIVQVSGRVQQVGFRFWTYREAMRLDIRGWVRNLPDGRVEACLAGMPEMLEQMMQSLEQGPPLAQVISVERRDIDLPDNIEGFRVLD